MFGLLAWASRRSIQGDRKSMRKDTKTLDRMERLRMEGRTSNLYSKGVAYQSPGSPGQYARLQYALQNWPGAPWVHGQTRKRTLKRFHKDTQPRRIRLLVQPFQGRSRVGVDNPGCARQISLGVTMPRGMAERPWALLCNSFGVNTGGIRSRYQRIMARATNCRSNVCFRFAKVSSFAERKATIFSAAKTLRGCALSR